MAKWKGRVVEYVIGHAGRRIVRRKDIYGAAPRLDAADWALIEKIRRTGCSINSDSPAAADICSSGIVGTVAGSMRYAEAVSRNAARENSAFFNDEMLAYWRKKWAAEDALLVTWGQREEERHRRNEELREQQRAQREQREAERRRREEERRKKYEGEEQELIRERRHWLDEQQKSAREAEKRQERWKKEEPDWGYYDWIISTALPFDQAEVRFRNMQENNTNSFQIIFCDSCRKRFQANLPNTFELKVPCGCGNMIDIKKVGCNFLPG